MWSVVWLCVAFARGFSVTYIVCVWYGECGVYMCDVQSVCYVAGIILAVHLCVCGEVWVYVGM